MATWTDFPVDEITARGREVRPGHGRILITLFLGVFWVLGWLAGRFWLATRDCVIAVRIGYWRGRGLTAEKALERVMPPEPAPAPG
jgi:hypothetical protein